MLTAGHQPWALITAFFSVLLGPGAIRASGPEPTPTPTVPLHGREIHLSQYADQRDLDRNALRRPDGSLVIDNETVERLSDRGVLVLGAPMEKTGDSNRNLVGQPAFSADPKLIERWRSRVNAQRERIAKVSTELALLEARIDALEDAALGRGRGAAKTRARIDEAVRRRRVVEHQLKREKAKLGAIVRQARQDGAQPGWFR